ncbi:Rcd1 [Cynara cardunculus var. scolymus]|uniref:Rcd1 n=1 Tax=Cynara cardunculus var. scolymus TaxID=59895 RepID=A0A103Y3W8_CYNCS|nr:Rcd1 [Cynara cardunculus var. scolymus]
MQSPYSRSNRSFPRITLLKVDRNHVIELQTIRVLVLQAMASHPDTKMAIVKAKIPVYIYPFLNTTEQRHKHFDYLRLTSLGVIGALVKVAAFVVSKILMYEEGQRYCGSFPERFYAVVQVLAKIVDQFPGKPSLQLLKHILTCFMRLSEVSRKTLLFEGLLIKCCSM